MTGRDLLEGVQLALCIAGAIVVCALLFLGIPWLAVSFLAWNMDPAEWGDAYRGVAVAWFAVMLIIGAGLNS